MFEIFSLHMIKKDLIGFVQLGMKYKPKFVQYLIVYIIDTKIRLLQSYEALWIHVIDMICIWAYHTWANRKVSGIILLYLDVSGRIWMYLDVENM